MSAQTPARFGLRIPQSWIEFDVWRATRTGELARVIDARIAELPELRPHRATLLKAFRRLAEQAEAQGAIYCAAAAGDIDEGEGLLASVTVFSTEGMPEPALNTVEAIVAQLPATARGDGDEDWREVSIIDHPAGRAVRVSEVSTTIGETDGFRMVAMQTLIPMPGADSVLNVVLTSPRLDLTDELLDLFDAISGTLTWEEGPAPR